MKKITIFLFLILILTGCSKKYNCTYTEDNNGILKEETMNLVFKKDNLIKVIDNITLTLSSEYKDAIKSTYDTINSEYRKYKKLEGYIVKTKLDNNKIITNLKIDLNKTKSKSIHLFDTSLKKDEIINELEENGYVCK